MDSRQVERRLKSVSILIEKSSAARQITASANPAALALRDKARALYQQAQAAYKAGDPNKTTKLLSQAAMSLFRAARLATPKQFSEQKAQHDFRLRLASVKALASAQKRIATEKGIAAKIAPLNTKIATKIQEASDLATAGKLDKAGSVLNQAYAMAKVSIEGMRKGDTLVRSLHFATKEDEYRYEVDRNKTYFMLIKMLLEEKKDQPGVVAMAQKFVNLAEKLRKQALELAAKGDYEGGIKKLEDSDKQVIRAIRSAGLYIPG